MITLSCGQQMHVSTRNLKSKTEAMYFLLSLLQADHQKDLPLDFQLNVSVKSMQSTNKFKYLGAVITPCLTKDTKIKAELKGPTPK